jgi:hypothetical protein
MWHFLFDNIGNVCIICFIQEVSRMKTCLLCNKAEQSRTDADFICGSCIPELLRSDATQITSQYREAIQGGNVLRAYALHSFVPSKFRIKAFGRRPKKRIGTSVPCIMQEIPESSAC